MIRFAAPFAHSRSRRPGRGVIVLSLAMLIAGTGIRAQPTPTDTFVPGLEDVPLMAGLRLETDQGFVFDKPDGRLVEAVATGRARQTDVVRFYTDTLSQLGWRHLPNHMDSATLVFRRGDERLTITTRTAKQGILVRFSLAPR